MSTLPRPTFGRARGSTPPVPARPLAEYDLTVPQDARRALARGWLWLGLIALIGSGLFSILLVLSRTPGINQLLPAANFFHVALVLHVDLSVLVWFVALGGLLWSLNGTQRAAGAGGRGAAQGAARPVGAGTPRTRARAPQARSQTGPETRPQTGPQTGRKARAQTRPSPGLTPLARPAPVG